MGTRNKGAFKYVCAECKVGFYVWPREMIRAAGVKCPACGSRFVDRSPYSESNKVMPMAEDARRAAESRPRSQMGWYDE